MKGMLKVSIEEVMAVGMKVRGSSDGKRKIMKVGLVVIGLCCLRRYAVARPAT